MLMKRSRAGAENFDEVCKASWESISLYEVDVKLPQNIILKYSDKYEDKMSWCTMFL